MKQNWMEQMKAGEGRTLLKALKACYLSEDTNIGVQLSRCYHLDRQISCLHQQSQGQPINQFKIYPETSNTCIYKYTHTKNLKINHLAFSCDGNNMGEVM